MNDKISLLEQRKKDFVLTNTVAVPVSVNGENIGNTITNYYKDNNTGINYASVDISTIYLHRKNN